MTTLTNVSLKGAPNFRDIGGWDALDNSRVIEGRIFRSGELSNLTEDDLKIVSQLNIGCVVDLRSEKEKEVHVSRLPDDLIREQHQANISADIRIDGKRIFDVLSECKHAEEAAEIMQKTFLLWPQACGPAVAFIARKLSVDDSPIVFHCTNGRDRTGVVAALLLAMLGASTESIVYDFMLTNERIDVEKTISNSIKVYKQMGLQIDRRTMELISLLRPQFIDALFAGIDEAYGCLSMYFDSIGVDSKMRNLLQERLLERR
jgi:protein-tyrosine phosphatase